MAPIAYEKDGGGGGLQDAYIRHGINLSRFSTHEVRTMLAILDTANTQIQAIISKAKTVETNAKYRRIAKEINRVCDRLKQDLSGQLELEFKELAGEEIRFVEKALQSIGVQAALGSPTLTPERIFQSAAFGAYSQEGRETFESYLNTFGDNVYKLWDSEVRAAYLTGMTAQQINRRVLGSVKEADPGAMRALRNSLEMNTRTQIAYMGNEARKAVYVANSGLFSGYRRIETLDSRTCVVCGALPTKRYIRRLMRLRRSRNTRTAGACTFR
jgi:hypothetical protein